MNMHLPSIVSVVAFSIVLAVGPNSATAATKTIAECNAEYTANKDAIQGAGQKKADFVTACRAGTEVIPGGTAKAAVPATGTAPAASSSVANVKTVKECNAEYAANKAAIQGGGETKANFVAACRAGTETIPTASTAPGATATTPTTTTTNTTSKPAKIATPAPNATVAPTGANQYASEAQAKAHCPGKVVVWVNLQSQIFHFSGYKNYGATKEGAYMCQTDAVAEGARAAKGEKQPS
jgi:hypothetical protein